MVAGILGSVETLGVLESATGGQKPFQKEKKTCFPDKAFYRNVRVLGKKMLKKCSNEWTSTSDTKMVLSVLGMLSHSFSFNSSINKHLGF